MNKYAKTLKRMHAWILSLSLSLIAGLFAGMAPVKNSAQAAPAIVNLAAGKEAYASSCQNSGSDGDKAVDGDTGSRWESAWSEAQSWIYVDLGAVKNFTSLEFLWEGAYATSYEVFTSNDEMNWTSIYTNANSDGAADTINVAGSARYIRVSCYKKSFTAYGYSMYEFRVYGQGEATESYDYGADLAAGKPAYGSSTLQEWWLYNEDVTADTHVTDGDTVGTRIMDGAVVSSNALTRWWSNRDSAQWLYVDLGQKQTIGKVEIDWSDCSGRIYDIQVSDDKTNWTTVYRAINASDEKTSVPMYTSGRYVRMQGYSYNGTNGYCVYSMRVYGYPQGAPKPTYEIKTLPTAYVGKADTGLGTYLADSYGFVQPRYPAYKTEDVESPIESNGWWQNIMIFRYSNALCVLPMKMQYSPKGLGIWTPTEGWATGGSVTVESTPDFYIMPEGMDAATSRAEVAGYSDFAVTANFRDDAHIGMTNTIIKGSPYTFTEFGQNTEAYIYSTAITKIFDNNNNAILTESGTAYTGDHIGIEVTDSDNKTGTYGSKYYYCINVPAGTRFLRVGNKIKMSFPSTGAYLSTATMRDAASLNYYYQHGYAFVTDTDVSYQFNETTADVTTTYTLTTQLKRAGFSDQTMITLLPHQWKVNVSPLTNVVYPSIRGDLKMHEGNSFTTVDKFLGITPQFTTPENPEFDREAMIEYLDLLVESTNGNLMASDAYWQGKTAHPLAMGLLAADQLGLTSYKKIFIQRLKVIFEDWFTYSGDGDNCFLYYDPVWGTLYYRDSEFGANTGITDHHFTYGYFTFSASILAAYDDEFYRNYGSMIELLIRDYANYSDSDDMFCQFRNFDPYDGHSWAGGYADNDSGNNQEAAGESLFGWVGSYMWGVKSGNTAIRDSAIYGFTTEMSAIKNYWFDFDQDVWLKDWEYHGVGQVYGSTYFFGTFFHGDPIYVYGIHWLPTSEYISYYGMDQAGIRRLYEGLEDDVVKRQAVAEPGYHVSTPDEGWQHINWTILSLYDPALALQKWAAGHQGVQENEKYNAYWFINNMATLGVRTNKVWAEGGVSATVYEKNGQYQALVWNPTNTEIKINFRDASGVIGSATVAPIALGKVNPYAANTYVNVPAETEDPYVDPLEGIKVSDVNLAYKKNTTTSSNEGVHAGANAVDGDLTTRWSSQATDNQWFSVDLGASYNVCKVVINWEAAYASHYKIETSLDGVNWTNVYQPKKGYGGTEEIGFTPIEARYVRFTGIDRKTAYGYSFFEFKVYGTEDGQIGTGEDPKPSDDDPKPSDEDPKPSDEDPTQPSQENPPVDDSLAGNVNIALNKKIFASGHEDAGTIEKNANDGNLNSRWGSDFAADAYIYVDLFGTYDVCKVVLNWQAAYGKKYDIQVSEDGINWKTVYTENAGDGGADVITFNPVKARYVKMQGIERFFADYGYSLFEFEVYATKDSYAQVGDVEDLVGVNLALQKPAEASTNVAGQTPGAAVDGNAGSRWESLQADPQWWSVDLGKKYSLDTIKITWEGAYSKQYIIQVSDDGETWTDVYTQNNGEGGNEEIALNNVAGRYVKLYSVKRGTGYGVSFFEFEVYGDNYKDASEQPPVEEKDLPFKDVAKGSWYYDAVKEVYELGIMTGNSAGTLFTPDGVMTRGMIVNVLYRLDGSPKTTYQAGFKDVDAKKYYAVSVNWAVQNGIVKGYSDNTFRPDEEITREQMVIILYYYAKYLGMDVSKSIDLSEYKDNAKIHSYALAPIKWAVAEGIMSGSSSKQLNPLQTVTRAQAAKMLAGFNHLKEATGK